MNKNPLVEDLLIPGSKFTDCQRVNLFTSHITQFIELENSEPPRIFTGYEMPITNMAKDDAFISTNSEIEIYADIAKNDDRKFLIFNKGDHTYDVKELFGYRYYSEEYGSIYELGNYEKGDILPKDTVLAKTRVLDDDMLPAFGVNLNAVYMSNNSTHEDAIQISATGAKKLASNKIKCVEIMLNDNDMLIPYFKDDHIFPSKDDDTDLLAIRRRINHDNILTMTNKKFKKTKLVEDHSFYGSGDIIDIELFFNGDVKKLQEERHEELYVYYQNEEKYYRTIVQRMRQIQDDDPKATFTEDFMFYRKYATEWLENRLKWVENREFSFLFMRIYIKEHLPIYIGSKLTGRYGNKGVVSEVIPDDQMPYNQFGERADIILAPLGVPGRLNIGQLYEQHMNYLSDNILRNVRESKTIKEKMKWIDFHLEHFYINWRDFYDSEKELIADIEEHGFYIQMVPFDGLPGEDGKIHSFSEYWSMVKEYEAKGLVPYTLKYVDDEGDIHDYINDNIIMGQEYFYRLRHEPIGKLSNRAAGTVNRKNIPDKNSFKQTSRIAISNTPVRCGEMETYNLAISKNLDLAKFIKAHSTSEVDRKNMVRNLLKGNKSINIEGRSEASKMIKQVLRVFNLDLLIDEVEE